VSIVREAPRSWSARPSQPPGTTRRLPRPTLPRASERHPGPHESILPLPPTDRERVAYLEGGQKRWALLLGVLGFTIISVSMARFALAHVVLYPFLGVVAIAGISSGLGLLTSTRRRRLNLADHERLVREWTAETPPSVDVLLPSAGETLEVLAHTFYHVSRLQWAGDLTTYVLDDSAREEVEVLALQYGFRYLTRPDRGHLKKAGNLKFGYDHSAGDLILVFDADFVPRPDMLRNLVPYMDDPRLGIVQSPQFFDGDDRRMNWLQHGAGTTQELFYRWVQPSRDRAGAPICVGTNALYRRAALAAAGGFAQIGHSEDVHTGVKLRKAGYHTRYVPVNLAKGLCPDTLASFINQQYRWCTGSMSLLKDRSFHAAKMGLSAKLAFWSGFSYYITTALFVFTMPLPTITMLWFYPHAVEPSNYLPLLPSFLMVWIALPRIMHARWTPGVLRVQMVYSFAHALAIYDTLRGRTAAWVPTGTAQKGTPLATKVRWLLLVWITFTLVATVLGLLRGLVGPDPLSYVPVAALTALTAYVKVPALLRIRDPRQPRHLKGSELLRRATGVRGTALRRAETVATG
jgi:cellulose synthase (UDP-forming)